MKKLRQGVLMFTRQSAVCNPAVQTLEGDLQVPQSQSSDLVDDEATASTGSILSTGLQTGESSEIAKNSPDTTATEYRVQADCVCTDVDYNRVVMQHVWHAFSVGLYDKYDFLEYSLENDAVYCFPCRFFGSKMGHFQEIAFTIRGFRNWKRSDRILDHHKSKYHRDCVAAWSVSKCMAATGNIAEQQCSYHAIMVHENAD